MISKNSLKIIEQERNVFMAIDYLEKTNDKDLDTYLRIIFLMLDFLVDGKYSEEEHEVVSLKIKQIFNEAQTRYSDNDEFLFFSGLMICIAEWYFGIDSVDEAIVMLNKAKRSEPKNLLYKWGALVLADERSEVNTQEKFILSKQLLEDHSLITLMKNRGLLGEYILGIIQNTYNSND